MITSLTHDNILQLLQNLTKCFHIFPKSWSGWFCLFFYSILSFGKKNCDSCKLSTLPRIMAVCLLSWFHVTAYFVTVFLINGWTHWKTVIYLLVLYCDKHKVYFSFCFLSYCRDIILSQLTSVIWFSTIIFSIISSENKKIFMSINGDLRKRWKFCSKLITLP